jgi:hypothetical protein
MQRDHATEVRRLCKVIGDVIDKDGNSVPMEQLAALLCLALERSGGHSWKTRGEVAQSVLSDIWAAVNV